MGTDCGAFRCRWPVWRFADQVQISLTSFDTQIPELAFLIQICSTILTIRVAAFLRPFYRACLDQPHQAAKTGVGFVSSAFIVGMAGVSHAILFDSAMATRMRGLVLARPRGFQRSGRRPLSRHRQQFSINRDAPPSPIKCRWWVFLQGDKPVVRLSADQIPHGELQPRNIES